MTGYFAAKQSRDSYLVILHKVYLIVFRDVLARPGLGKDGAQAPHPNVT